MRDATEASHTLRFEPRRASAELSGKHRIVWGFAPGGHVVGAAGDDDGLVDAT